MPQSRPKKNVLATFEFPFTMEVRTAKFEPLASNSLLDLSRLAKGNHRIEIGSATGGCCPARVRAIVRNGIVTNLEIEPCKGNERLSGEDLAIVEEAYRRIRRSRSSKWKPVPVATFFASASRMAGITISWKGWCIQVCWKTSTHTMTCIRCCATLRCTRDTISTGRL